MKACPLSVNITYGSIYELLTEKDTLCQLAYWVADWLARLQRNGIYQKDILQPTEIMRQLDNQARENKNKGTSQVSSNRK